MLSGLLNTVGRPHIIRHLLPSPKLNLNFLSNGIDLSALTVNRSADLTYRNSNGDWAKVGANTPAIHHTPKGNPLGLLIQDGRTAKNEYARPSADAVGDHFSSGSSNVNVVTDATAPFTSDFTNNDQVWEIANSSGSDVTVEWSGTTGNTNVHNWQCVYKIVSGDHAFMSLSGVKGFYNIDGASGKYLTATDWHYEEDTQITPGASGNVLRLVVPDGVTIRVAMVNLQEDSYTNGRIRSHTTTFIDTAGASASRPDDLTTIDISGLTDGTQFSMAIKGQYFGGESNLSGVVMVYDGSSRGSEYFLSRINTNGDYKHVNEAGNFNTTINKDHLDETSSEPDIPAPTPTDIDFAIRHALNDQALYSDGQQIWTETAGDLATGIDTIALFNHSAAAGNYGTSQYIESIQLWSEALTNAQLKSLSWRNYRFPIMTWGQSNSDIEQRGFQTGTPTYDDGTKGGGELFTERMMYPQVGGYINIRGTDINKTEDTNTGGGSLLKKNNPADFGGATDGYYWDENTNSPGTLYDRTLAHLRQWKSAGRIKYVKWDQWQFDVQTTNTPALVASEYEPALQALFERFKQDNPNVHFLLCLPARRTDTSDELAQAYREAHINVANALSDYVTIASEPYIFNTQADAGVSLSKAHWELETDFIKKFQWEHRKLMELEGIVDYRNTDGPSITGGSFSSGNSYVDVTISHDDLSDDFTPTTGIRGFLVKVNGAEQADAAATRQDATTIRVPVDSTLSGGDVVTVTYPYYFTGHTGDKFIRDNSPWEMPLKAVIDQSIDEV